jgi:hypothetical protein
MTSKKMSKLSLFRNQPGFRTSSLYLICDEYNIPRIEPRDALKVLYQSLCPLLNYFLSAMKLIGKAKAGSCACKVYERNNKIDSPVKK